MKNTLLHKTILLYKNLLLGVVCVSLFITGLYVFIKTHQEFAANFADNTLRPLIGSQATILLESLFFNAEDQANQIKYSFFHAPLTFTDITTKKVQTKLPSLLAMEGLVPQTPATTSSLSQNSFLLAPITPLLQGPLLGEGQWTPLTTTNQAILMAKTYYRPDPDRPYALTTLVKINMQQVQIGMVAGLREPGGPSHPGPGMTPLPIQQSNALIAAFDGGFQQKDGFYGMIVANTTYLPLQKNIATFIIHNNTSPEITKYTGQNLGNDITAIRQNGPMLIENGNMVTTSSTWNMQTWGLTTTNSMYTWRSGVGITKDGSLIFACGPSLVPETLAKALYAAGAKNAMQLDINPVWVRFILFNAIGNGQYKYYPLENEMVNGGYQYLHGYQKDFFYLYRKS